jgi:glycosyltransferase involved in cell wall biosynthesis
MPPRISVIIPAYNCAKTIRLTLESVFRQTLQPDEILVLDDGSTDDTKALLESFKPRITVISQQNSGSASARNTLVAKATGDLIAILDSDDLWHPTYLEVMRRLYVEHPTAVAFFAGLENFIGFGNYEWGSAARARSVVEIIQPLEFFRRYNRASGFFVADCCIPKAVFDRLGPEPYREMGAEDSYCFSLLALLGPVVHVSTPLVARRIYENSLSANHLWTFGIWVRVFEVLEARFRAADAQLWKAFRSAHASKRRAYAKLLMGAGKVPEARGQLRRSLLQCYRPDSLAKSLALLSLSFMPRPMQPAWPPSHRQWQSAPQEPSN